MASLLTMSDLIATLKAIVLHYYLFIFAITLLYYDHAITLFSEIEYIWGRPKSVSSVLFILNRYLAFFGNLVVAAFSLRALTDESCKHFHTFRELLMIINQAIVCILLAIRTYALYSRRLSILLLFVGSAVILIALNIWAMIGQHNYDLFPGGPCPTVMSSASNTRIAAPWEGLVIFDAMVFILTVMNTRNARAFHGMRFSGKLPLAILMLRDGSIYFVIMAVANLANILTFYLASPSLKGMLSQFGTSISVTMISRLMLNMRETGSPVTSPVPSRPSGAQQTLGFAPKPALNSEISLVFITTATDSTIPSIPLDKIDQAGVDSFEQDVRGFFTS